MKYFFLFCIIFLASATSRAQDSSRLRVSLLTCSPGTELYATFGHSALRVIDSNSVTDIVFNYGTFDPTVNNFYLKFIRGQLRYFLSIENFSDFRDDYAEDGRGISEQVLLMRADEKIALRHALIENLRDENKFYTYNFFYDNCTTRLRDLALNYEIPPPQLPAVMPAGSTFRDALHTCMNTRDMSWWRLGFDLLLGRAGDSVMTAPQQDFLPLNLSRALAAPQNSSLVAPPTILLPAPKIEHGGMLLTPGVTFSALLFIFLLVSLSHDRRVLRVLHGLDAFLFLAVGGTGVLLFVVSCITDYTVMQNNYNLLWAWPTHLLFAFFFHRNTKWVRLYALFTAIFLLLFLAAWSFLPQHLNSALIPLIVLMIVRALSKFLRRSN